MDDSREKHTRRSSACGVRAALFCCIWAVVEAFCGTRTALSPQSQQAILVQGQSNAENTFQNAQMDQLAAVSQEGDCIGTP
jgi:hypothetical protein